MERCKSPIASKMRGVDGLCPATSIGVLPILVRYVGPSRQRVPSDCGASTFSSCLRFPYVPLMPKLATPRSPRSHLLVGRGRSPLRAGVHCVVLVVACGSIPLPWVAWSGNRIPSPCRLRAAGDRDRSGTIRLSLFDVTDDFFGGDRQPRRGCDNPWRSPVGDRPQRNHQ